jgi:Zn-dependent metalloprotease
MDKARRNGVRGLQWFGWLGLVILALAAWPQAAQPALAATDESPQSLFMHPVIAPDPALGQQERPQGREAASALELARVFVEGQTTAQPAPAAAVAANLGWQVAAPEERDGTRTVVRLTQHAHELPIFGADVVAQVEDGVVVAVKGQYLASVAASPKPALTIDAAFKIASGALAPEEHAGEAEHHEDEAEHLGHEHVTTVADPVLAEHELLFFNPALFDAGAPETALAYRLVVDERDGSVSMTIFVDAVSGKVWMRYPNQQGGLSRAVINANGTEIVNNANMCHNESGPIGPFNSLCATAFQHTGEAYNYFRQTHNRDSFDGRGAQIVVAVNYGTAPNAFWNGRFTAYGPGFATRDVVGHELTHAVVQYTAGLIYANQSGALNESFADIFGVMIDRDDWLLGEETPIGALRNMANPPARNHPDRLGNFVCTTQDNGGVHTNSSISNKTAYLMSEGGSFNGRNVPAIGRDATERIFYRALTNYLTRSSGFNDLYQALLSAATDLYGAGSAQVNATTIAAQATEINQPLSCGGGGNAQPDAFEPDNSPVAAKQITSDVGSQFHNFHTVGDVDWVYFSAVQGVSYVIETLNLEANADTVLALYGTDTVTELATNDDIEGSRASRIAFTAPASGNFGIKVRHYNSNAGGANTGYDLRLRATSQQPAGDSFEPDNQQIQAKTIVPGGQAQRHNFHSAGDVDWVIFNAVAGNSYVVETFDLGAASDTVLSLYSGSNLIVSNDDADGRASRVTVNVTGSGFFLVAIRQYDSRVAGANTDYSLRVFDTAPAGDGFEPDNSRAVASPIVVDGQGQLHSINRPGDEDWIRFAVTPGNSYFVETYNLAAGVDTVLELYDEAGNLLTRNDDFNGMASLVGFAPNQAGTLYARVRHYSASAGGRNLTYAVAVSSEAGFSPGMGAVVEAQGGAQPQQGEQPTISVELVEPTQLTLSGRGFLVVATKGVLEVPKVYLVTETVALQLSNVSPAPDGAGTFIVEVPAETKPGSYKLRVVASDGAEAVSREVITLTAPDGPGEEPVQRRRFLPLVTR